MGALDEILIGILVAVVTLLISKYISKTVGLVLLVVAITVAILFRDPAMDRIQILHARLQGVASAGTVMYQADVGSAFAAWLSPGPGRDKASTDWKLVGDLLVNDGTKAGGSYIQMPYEPANADYAIETDIKVVRLAGPHPQSCVGEGSKSFGLYFREDRDVADDAMTGADYLAVTYEDDEGRPGDDCDERNIKLRSYRIETLASGPSTPPSSTNTYVTIDEDPFEPGSGWHTYRLEAKANALRLYVDGELLIQGTDNQFVSSGIVALFSRNVELNVRNFKVIAL